MKDAMLRSNASAFETSMSLVGMLSRIRNYKLPDNYIALEEAVVNNMTLDDIKAEASYLAGSETAAPETSAKK